MLSPETFELLQKGGPYVLLVIAIVWLVGDRNRLLKSLSDKDDEISAKDDKLGTLSERTIVTLTEIKGLLQSVVDIFNSPNRR